ncbi:MAG: DUF2079 domain-containing protein [Methylomicrobium sp.]
MNYKLEEKFNSQAVTANAVQSQIPYRSLLICRVLYFLGTLLLGLDRHWSFKTSINDTGAFDQAIWSILNQGAPMVTMGSTEPYHWFGVHFHPWLYLYALLYKIYPGPEWLILTQSVAIASTTLPIFKTALRLSYTHWQSFFWSLGFLLNPFVLSAVQWDFHPVSIATPLIAWSIYFLLTNDFRKLLLCILIVLLCQEQFGILTMCLGLSYFIVNKNFKKSLCLVAIGGLYTFISFQYVFPKFSPTGTHIMMSAQYAAANRYSWLGNSLSEIITHLLTSPLEVFKKAFLEMGGGLYIIFLLLPYGLFLPFLGFDILLIGAADFAANALSLLDLQRSINSYHSVALIPIILVASMRGYRFLSARVSPRVKNPIGVLAVFTSVLFLSFCLPHLLGQNSFWKLNLIPAPKPDLGEIESRLPAQSMLSVQANVGPHFSQHESLYIFPKNIPKADAVILRMEDPDDSLGENTIRFSHYMMMQPKDYLTAIRCVLDSGSYRIGYFNPPWLLLLKSGGKSSDAQHLLLAAHLNTLENRWGIKIAPADQGICEQFH